MKYLLWEVLNQNLQVCGTEKGTVILAQYFSNFHKIHKSSDFQCFLTKYKMSASIVK